MIEDRPESIHFLYDTALFTSFPVASIHDDRVPERLAFETKLSAGDGPVSFVRRRGVTYRRTLASWPPRPRLTIKMKWSKKAWVP